MDNVYTKTAYFYFLLDHRYKNIIAVRVPMHAYSFNSAQMSQVHLSP